MMSDHTPATLSVQVIHGKREGPTLFVSAAIHGDEIIGVEIIRRLSRIAALRRISGTILFIPIVNSFGFISKSRYLPDRRDLNRSFPGNVNGSLAGRLANLFLAEVVARSDYGIDLHSAAVNRSNLPQLRIDFSDQKAAELARMFSPPITLNSALREGSLRLAAQDHGVPVIVFEAGEGLRLDELSVRVGVKGILRVMHHLGMIKKASAGKGNLVSHVATNSSWQRAVEGGILRALCDLGDFVQKDDTLGIISDPFGNWEAELKAGRGGLIVGRTNLPIVNQGDALFHIASLSQDDAHEASLSRLEDELEADPLFDEDEIV